MTDFDTALATFVAGCQSIIERNIEANFPSVTVPTLSVDPRGKKYKRIVRTGPGETSVHCFVHAETGDVLKAAGWKAPAKGARGNIFDDHNGLARMTPYGAGYNR